MTGHNSFWKRVSSSLRACTLGLACLVLATTTANISSYAAEWPSDVSIDADAGIVMDADTGTILYGKNIHDTYAPASITKVLTALVVLDNCEMNETVKYTAHAVNDVEDGSSSAGYSVGDETTVEVALYSLLLKSANESANALADHVAGSKADFVELMNKKAKELGCVDSHFNNPSGLNDEEHYVSAYDMALITRAAFENETFCRISATTYYELPPNARNPQGLGISPGNRMIKKNWPQEYMPECIGGKTGYTSIALNTLVTGAEKDGRRLITAVLHSDGTTYSDTKKLVNFGFSEFKTLDLTAENSPFEKLLSDLSAGNVPLVTGVRPQVIAGSHVVVPVDVEVSDITCKADFSLEADAPANACARLHFDIDGHEIGSGWLGFENITIHGASKIPEELLEGAPALEQLAADASEKANVERAAEEARKESVRASKAAETASGGGTAGADNSDKKDKESGAAKTGRIHGNHQKEEDPMDKLARWALILGIIGGVVLAVLLSITALKAYDDHQRRKEEAATEDRKKRRRQRFRADGMTEEEFDDYVKKHREKRGKE